MMNLPPIRFLLATALLGAAGCANTVPLQQTPLTQDEVDRFLAGGRDARYYGITTYSDAAGPRFESANRAHLARTVQMDFTSPKKEPFPVIQAQSAITDPFPMLLDSSSRQNWLVLSAAKAMEYRPFAPPTGEYADHVVSDIPGYAGVGNKLILDDFHIEYPIFYVAPAQGGLGPLARIAELPDLDPATAKTRGKFARRMPATMGAAAMRSLAYIRFDFPGRTVRLSSTEPYRPAAAAAANLPMRDWRGRPAAQAMLNGKPITLVIDTAGDFDLSLPGEVSEGALGALILGDLQIDDAEIASHASLGLPEEFPARLGLGVLADYAVTLDFKNRRIWFENPFRAEEETPDPSADDDDPEPIQYRGVRP